VVVSEEHLHGLSLTYGDLPDDLVSLVTQGTPSSAYEACPCAGDLGAFCLLRREKTCHNVTGSQ
jgi:hypothetical protein